MLPLLGGDSAQYAHVAIGTSAATIIITSLRSVTSHNKRGSVDFQILKTWAPWIVLGDGLGVILASHVDGHVLTMVFARSEEHTSELQSLMRISYAVFCLKKKNRQ